jgi:glutamine synthetase
MKRIMVNLDDSTGAALEGVPQDVSDEEVAAHPDAASCRVLPWNRDIAWFASDLWCRGQPFDAWSAVSIGVYVP